MLAGNFKIHKHHVYKKKKVDLLKASAIYGANGAGKSNFIKAIDYFRKTVIAGKIEKTIDDKKFKLNKISAKKPVSFEMEFVFSQKIYTYGFSITDNVILEEWLFESGSSKIDRLIFERKQDKTGKLNINMGVKYRKTKKQIMLLELIKENLLQSNELLIGKSQLLKIKEISEAGDWIKKKIIVIYPKSKFWGLVPLMDESANFNATTNELLETLDTGVEQIRVDTINFENFFGKEDDNLRKEIEHKLLSQPTVWVNPKMGDLIAKIEDNKYVVKKIVALHKNSKGDDISFNVNEESDGTQRILDLIPAIILILQASSTVIIDEIDRSIHPSLLQALITKIMSDVNTNGQLIFTTHESSLLDMSIFRPDEIWFTEKDKISGATTLYSLSEFRPRYDLDISKGYLKGRFGAIPFLANLRDLNWKTTNA
jgi:AAA15 family ATPase/GTPase